MKINIIPRLLWSPLMALLAMAGATFITLGSAAPVPTRQVGSVAITRKTLSLIPIKVHPPVVTPVIHKRNFLTAMALKAPESESVNDIGLSKRRAMVCGKVGFVGHPKYYTRSIPPTASPDDERPQH